MFRIFLSCVLISSSLISLRADEILSRPVIIGASVSDGYEHTERLGGPRSDALALDHYLCKITDIPADRFSNFSQRFCFLHPLVSAHQQMSNTLETKPTLVIAVDQLFWQLYGNYTSTEQRLITFKAALAKLDTITCPLVIGNIPDASLAIGKMLSASQVPDQETINQANQILDEWVKKRKQTAIIDLASFMQLCVSDKEIKLKNITYPAGTTKKLLQSDMLHPTTSGVMALSYAIIESLQSISDIKDADLKLPVAKTAQNIEQ